MTTAKHLLSEIVAGLDGVTEGPLASKGVTVSEDSIRSIAAYVEQLEKALEPFAKAAEFLDTDIPDLKDTHGWTFQAIDFRRARAALGGSNE